ncbi:hypothetical protein JGC56_18065 [Salmonella enterica subsp. enterica serovar Saintpaul]|nr:hypothetical protein [Salmonella enterica subsp. enterica serovar Saintpaul]
MLLLIGTLMDMATLILISDAGSAAVLRRTVPGITVSDVHSGGFVVPAETVWRDVMVLP